MKLQKRIQSKRNAAGFTLLEIMVVIAIIGMLATFILPNVIGQGEKARQATVKQHIAAISSGLQQYYLDNGNFPDDLSGLLSGGERGPQGGYLQALPKDPWGNDYQYTSQGQRGGRYDIWTYGADGQEGGSDENADIGNWTNDNS